jgi:hypothetical protein
MIEAFGFELGTVFQGGTLAALIVIAGVLIRAYIVGIPDRVRAQNEVKVSEVQRLTAEVERVSKAQRDCEGREADLRVKVRELEDNQTGVYRMLIQRSADDVIAMGDTVPPHILQLAIRTKATQARSAGGK